MKVVFRRSCILSNWNLEVLVFEESRKLENPQKNLLDQSKLNPHMATSPEWNPAHIGWRQVLHHYAIPSPCKYSRSKISLAGYKLSFLTTSVWDNSSGSVHLGRYERLATLAGNGVYITMGWWDRKRLNRTEQHKTCWKCWWLWSLEFTALAAPWPNKIGFHRVRN